METVLVLVVFLSHFVRLSVNIGEMYDDCLDPLVLIAVPVDWIQDFNSHGDRKINMYKVWILHVFS